MELSMMEKVPKQKSVKICPIPYHKDDPINSQLDNTRKILVAQQPKSLLCYVVFPISEVNSSTPFNLLIRLK